MEVWWLYVYLCVYMSTSEPVTLKLDLIKGIHGFLDFSGRGACSACKCTAVSMQKDYYNEYSENDTEYAELWMKNASD